MFRGARKEELILIADELGEKTTPEMKVLDLKNLILNSEKYKNNKEFMDDYLDSIISNRISYEEQARADRKSKEEQARVTAESQLEFERINLEKVKLEIELGKINLERAKLESQRDSNELQRTNPETKQTSIENFILSVRTLTLPIPKKQEGWNLFFSSLERSFKTKNVPDEFKGEILLNLLGEKAENTLCRKKIYAPRRNQATITKLGKNVVW
ncbi:transposon Ty3-I Gag-Pol polyprotein [Trichonephila clavipes]|uniref:Transposon Ty3-I Gag-Pol polyprotein n=1 Tax=Trichonephila clavipes TaxID=2585209 RepID=A0A8X6SWY3_TRICX|nr:transposon Ty3-I Gag-Pol polyprotein [Trichonephila clavipes]